MTKRAEFHPLANIFPLMEGAAFDELKADIRDNGVRDEIVMYEGKILDGRNRYRALCALVDEGCELGAGLSLDPDTSLAYAQFETDIAIFGDKDLDPLSYVISKNLRRRHLDESQRAMVAARLATMRQGERTDLAESESISSPSKEAEKVDTDASGPSAADDRAQAWAMREAMAGSEAGAAGEPPAEPSANLPKVDQATAAELLNVSERSLRSAKAVQATGAPELQQAVDAGQVAVSTAAEVAKLPEAQQQEIVARGPKEILDAAKRIRAEKSKVKREARLTRIAELTRNNPELPIGTIYNVILEDPEWKFEVWGEGGMDRSAENHYPTSTLEELKARNVSALAADNCAYFLWVTGPMLEQGMELLRARGFAYKAMWVWRKPSVITGYWNRSRHEVLLLGTRGDVPAPLMGTQWESVLDAVRPDGHSSKPEVFQEMIEAYFPGLPKIELNRRGPARPGWDAWGNEAQPASVDTPANAVATAADSADASGDTAVEIADPVVAPPVTDDLLGGLQPRGAAPVERRPASPPEDDLLDIPSFLRRKPKSTVAA